MSEPTSERETQDQSGKHNPTDEPAITRGVDVLRRHALAFGFAFVALTILILLITIYWQLGREILWASALAVLFYPLHRRISQLVGHRATLASTISSILAIAILVIPAILIVFNLIAEVRNLWPSLRDALGPDAYQTISRWLETSPLRSIARLVLGIEPDTGPAIIEAKLAEAAISLQGFLLERLQAITKSVPAALIRLGITLVTFFFFLRHGAGWIRNLQDALPIETEHSRGLIEIAGQTVNAVFRGVILTAAAQGFLAGIGYWVAGAQTPILLGIATFVASMIPFVGAAGIWVPTCIILWISGSHWAAVGLAIWGTLVVSLVDNFLKPYLIGREMKLPVLWLFLAIIGGLKLFGFLGVIVGPAALALAFACYRIYTEGRKAPA
jgi:predicted PurR-regulated permease PerM